MQRAVRNARLGPAWPAVARDIVQTGEQSPVVPINVTAVGVDKRMLSAISMFFSIRHENRYAFGDPQDADIWLFDVDNADGRSEWATHRMERSGIPAILVSIEEISIGDVQNLAFAPKPLSAKALSEALERVTRFSKGDAAPLPKPMDMVEEFSGAPSDLANSSDTSSPPSGAEAAIGAPDARAPDSQDFPSGTDSTEPHSEQHQDGNVAEDTPEIASSRADEARRSKKTGNSAPECHSAAMKLDEQNARVYIGSRPDIDADDPQQVEQAQFNPERFLAGAVSNAVTQATRAQQPVRVAGKDWAIVARPNQDRAFVVVSRLNLRAIASLHLQGEPTTTLLDRSEPRQACDGIEWRLSTLQWTLALMAARGRVPQGTDINARVKLKSWPNLTRLETFPNAMRIASLWSRRPMSLLESAKLLGIPQRYVFSFYSAVHALGVVESLDTGKAKQVRSEDPPAKRGRGLFRKILAHLGL